MITHESDFIDRELSHSVRNLLEQDGAEASKWVRWEHHMHDTQSYPE